MTLVMKKESFLGKKTKEEFICDLRNLLKGKVDQAFIFGSFTHQGFNCDSDLDLILITPSRKNFVERPLDFPEILDLDFQVDLLVYTPEEFQKLREEKKVGFWKTVFSQMIQII